jgi:hypothetical protein
MRFIIEKGQKTFSFDLPLPDSDDYGISAIPSWDTTLFLMDKTNKGFKLGFGTPCPEKVGYLILTLYDAIKNERLFPKSNNKKIFREPKLKIPKKVNVV